jgi:WD40 repeat protein
MISRYHLLSLSLRIICLEINPVSDLFISAGKDQKFKLWDLQKKDPLPIAMLDLSSKNSIVVGNFDSTGVIFAIAYRETGNLNKIRLYDIDK